MPRRRNRIEQEDPTDLSSEELDVQVGEVQKLILAKMQDIEAAERVIARLREDIDSLKSKLVTSKTERSRPDRGQRRKKRKKNK